jgi:hypothetical protein
VSGMAYVAVQGVADVFSHPGTDVS